MVAIKKHGIDRRGGSIDSRELRAKKGLLNLHVPFKPVLKNK